MIVTKPVSINVIIMAITVKCTSYKEIVIDVQVRTAEDKKIFRKHQEDSMKLSGVGSLTAICVSTWLIPLSALRAFSFTWAISPDSDSRITTEESQFDHIVALTRLPQAMPLPHSLLRSPSAGEWLRAGTCHLLGDG